LEEALLWNGAFSFCAVLKKYLNPQIMTRDLCRVAPLMMLNRQGVRGELNI